MLPDIYQIRCFRTVAEEKSFTKAAEKLYISRQALSKTIQRVERDLGGALFVQDRKGLELTELGNVLFRSSTPLVSAYRTFENNMKEFADRRKPVLSLAASRGGLLSLGADVLVHFGRLHPEFMIDSEETPGDTVVSLVQSGEVELGILGSVPEYLEGVNFWPVVLTGMWLEFPADHLLAAKAALIPGDLPGEPVIGAGRHNHQQRFFLESCRREGVEPWFSSVISYKSTAEQTHTIQGFYFAFPESLRPAQDGWVVRPLAMPGAEKFGTYAIGRKGAALSRQARMFLEYLKERQTAV